MSMKRHDKQLNRQRKKKHIRKKIQGTTERPRLVVYRSLKHFYAQLIDDESHKTLLTVSDLSKDLKDEVAKAKTRKEVAKLIGVHMAQKAKDMKKEKVVFDRSGYIYHGRVMAFAEGAREGGLVF
ncbi:MAG: 50S ribosomal protein L18 [candidate division KSB1 bacterium]|nr:50S ribosomal protein L18 [candidate division KSB1 bacterium]